MKRLLIGFCLIASLPAFSQIKCEVTGVGAKLQGKKLIHLLEGDLGYHFVGFDHHEGPMSDSSHRSTLKIDEAQDPSSSKTSFKSDSLDLFFSILPDGYLSSAVIAKNQGIEQHIFSNRVALNELAKKNFRKVIAVLPKTGFEVKKYKNKKERIVLWKVILQCNLNN